MAFTFKPSEIILHIPLGKKEAHQALKTTDSRPSSNENYSKLDGTSCSHLPDIFLIFKMSQSVRECLESLVKIWFKLFNTSIQCQEGLKSALRKVLFFLSLNWNIYVPTISHKGHFPNKWPISTYVPKKDSLKIEKLCKGTSIFTNLFVCQRRIWVERYESASSRPVYIYTWT